MDMASTQPTAKVFKINTRKAINEQVPHVYVLPVAFVAKVIILACDNCLYKRDQCSEMSINLRQLRNTRQKNPGSPNGSTSQNSSVQIYDMSYTSYIRLSN